MGLHTLEPARVASFTWSDVQHRSFLIDVLVAVARIRVIAQPLRSTRAALLLDRPEYVSHVARIVSSSRHDLRAQQVGLLFVFTAEPQKRGSKAELRALRDHRSGTPSDNRAEHRASNLTHLVLRRFGRLSGSMSQRDVAQLVRHDARDLPFGVRLLDHPAIDEHRATGQRERVNLAHVDAGKRILEFRVLQVLGNGRDEPTPDRVQVRVHLLVAHHRELLRDLLSRLLPQLYVVGRAVLVIGRCYLRLCRKRDGCEHGHRRNARRMQSLSNHFLLQRRRSATRLRVSIAGFMPVMARLAGGVDLPETEGLTPWLSGRRVRELSREQAQTYPDCDSRLSPRPRPWH